jgi:hypothetical protein
VGDLAYAPRLGEMCGRQGRTLRGKGTAMDTVSIEVAGADAVGLAGELRAALAGAGERVSPVEVDRSTELVIAAISLALNGVGTAKTLWDWWSARRSKDVTVRILLATGAEVDLSGVDRNQLEVVFEKASKESGQQGTL